MDYLRRVCRTPSVYGMIKSAALTSVDRIQYKQILRYGNVKRMTQERYTTRAKQYEPLNGRPGKKRIYEFRETKIDRAIAEEY